MFFLILTSLDVLLDPLMAVSFLTWRIAITAIVFDGIFLDRHISLLFNFRTINLTLWNGISQKMRRHTNLMQMNGKYSPITRNLSVQVIHPSRRQEVNICTARIQSKISFCLIEHADLQWWSQDIQLILAFLILTIYAWQKQCYNFLKKKKFVSFVSEFHQEIRLP